MSQRITRVNEMLRRELSEQMRRYHRAGTVAITISSVDCSSDLRHARVYFSVLSHQSSVGDAEQLFRKIGKDLARRVSKQVVLKYFPRLEFMYDPSLERGSSINELIDKIEESELREDSLR